jgi:hypothetical protein
MLFSAKKRYNMLKYAITVAGKVKTEAYRRAKPMVSETKFFSLCFELLS